MSTEHLPATYGNVHDPLSRKFQHRWVGPFKILRMFGNAAELELSKDLQIHPVQNVSYLRPNLSTPHLNEPIPPPLRQTKNGGVQEVEAILDHAASGTNLANRKYLVRWEGFDSEHDEWLSESALSSAPLLLQNYKKEHGLDVEAARRRRKLERAKKVKKINLRVAGMEDGRVRRGLECVHAAVSGGGSDVTEI